MERMIPSVINIRYLAIHKCDILYTYIYNMALTICVSQPFHIA